MQVPKEFIDEFEEGGVPFLIIDIAGLGTSLSGTIVASMEEPRATMKLVEVSVKDAQLLQILLEAEGVEPGRSARFTLQFKMFADHLEGTGFLPDGAKETVTPYAMTWVARRTTRDKVVPPTRRPQSPDQRAFSSAMGKPAAEQTEALKQFLKDYPDFRHKELAILSLAMSYQSLDDRLAALRAFVAKFPTSPLKELAQAEIANAEKAKKAGVRKSLEPGVVGSFRPGFLKHVGPVA